MIQSLFIIVHIAGILVLAAEKRWQQNQQTKSTKASNSHLDDPWSDILRIKMVLLLLWQNVRQPWLCMPRRLASTSLPLSILWKNTSICTLIGIQVSQVSTAGILAWTITVVSESQHIINFSFVISIWISTHNLACISSFVYMPDEAIKSEHDGKFAWWSWVVLKINVAITIQGATSKCARWMTGKSVIGSKFGPSSFVYFRDDTIDPPSPVNYYFCEDDCITLLKDVYNKPRLTKADI